ncbi:MAG: type II toxin-antitoxin system Phd/YefM family antitoxin [Spirochaetaceae bacterium]|nr:MAG: type II toxin-antitoxin system Phd/YefM family antitoxin [Spirochaetaceae bacterium]
MKFITVRDIRTSPATIWKQLPEEQEMVITNNGKPIALLTPLTGETLEETVSAVRRARAVNAVRTMRRTAEERGLSSMTDEEIQAEIDESRRERAR